MEQVSEILSLAYQYHNQGLQLINLPYRSKKPYRGTEVIRDYCRPQRIDDIEKYFDDPNQNIAAFTGSMSGNHIVIEFDDKRYKTSALYNEFIRTPGVERLINETAVVDSLKGPHVHFKTPWPIKSMGRYKGLKIDILGENEPGRTPGYVLMPNSTHPDNPQQYLFRNDEKILQLDEKDIKKIPFELKRVERNEIDLSNIDLFQLPQTENPFCLPYHFWAIIQANSKALGKYHNDRSRAEQAVITYCVGQEWIYEQIFTLFTKHANPKTKFKEKEFRNPTYAEKWLYGSYKNAVKYVEQNSKEINQKLNAINVWFAQNQFTGRTADVDNAVFNYALQVAKRTGKPYNFGLSIREVGEKVGIHKNTAKKALNRIPYLDKIKKNEQNTNVFRINIPKNLKVTKSDNPTQPLGVKDCDTNVTLSISHDLFRRFGIGKNGLKVYSILVENGGLMSIAEIVDITEINKVTIKRKLERMIQAQIVISDGAKYNTQFQTVPNPNLDKAAEILGVAGKGIEQKIQHEQERRDYQRAITAHRKFHDERQREKEKLN